MKIEYGRRDITGKNERIRLTGTSNESPKETGWWGEKGTKHKIKYLLVKYVEGEAMDIFLRSSYSTQMAETRMRIAVSFLFDG